MECWQGGCGLTGIEGEIDQPACTDSDPRSKCPIDFISYSLKETLINLGWSKTQRKNSKNLPSLKNSPQPSKGHL